LGEYESDEVTILPPKSKRPQSAYSSNSTAGRCALDQRRNQTSDSQAQNSVSQIAAKDFDNQFDV
jgi:hypothetical protein